MGGIEYSGLHGAELLEPDSSKARVMPDFARFLPEVQAFARERDTPELRALRVRIEDKGPIVTFHWRGAPDEDAARALRAADRLRGGGGGAVDALGAQGARDPAAGADRQGPRRPGAARAGAGARRRCTRATT